VDYPVDSLVIVVSDVLILRADKQTDTQRKKRINGLLPRLSSSWIISQWIQIGLFNVRSKLTEGIYRSLSELKITKTEETRW